MPFTVLEHTLPIFHNVGKTNSKKSRSENSSINVPTTPITTPSESTTSLLSSRPSTCPSQKNYEAAFGQLSSSYGLGGPVPSFLSRAPQTQTPPQQQHRQSRSQPSSQPPFPKTNTPPNPTSNASQSPKNFEAAFGQLSSSYGFSGSVTPWSSRK